MAMPPTNNEQAVAEMIERMGDFDYRNSRQLSASALTLARDLDTRGYETTARELRITCASLCDLYEMFVDKAQGAQNPVQRVRDELADRRSKGA